MTSGDACRADPCPGNGLHLGARSAGVVCSALLLAAAFATVLTLSRRGVGVSPDSVTYLEAATNLHEGRGLVASAPDGGLQPLSHYPPLYPVVLSLLRCGVGSSLDAVGLLNGALLWLSLVSFFLLLRNGTGSTLVGMVGASSLLLAREQVGLFTWVWSEPLLTASLLLMLVGLMRVLERPSWPVLLATASAAALGALARYAGLAFAVAGALSILGLGWGVRARRVRDAFVFAAVSLGPSLVWMARNMADTGNMAQRSIVCHLPSLGKLSAGVGVITHWFIPWRLPLLPGLLLLGLAVLGWTVVFSRALRTVGRSLGPPEAATSDRTDRRSSSAPARLGLVALLMTASYAALLILTVSFLDASTPLDERLLAPLLPLLTLCVAVTPLVARQGRHSRSRSLRIATGCLLALVLLHAVRFVRYAVARGSDGEGFTAAEWRNSVALRTLGALEPSRPVYSNLEYAVRLLAKRPARSLPRRYDPTSLRSNDRYEAEVEAMIADLLQGDGVIVYFREQGRPYLVPQSWLDGSSRLIRVAEEGKAVFYRAAGP